MANEKTNTALVEYAKKAWSEKWGYVWGTYGKLLTEELLQQKINQYPEMVGGYEEMIRKRWMGRKVTDCVGLIKSFLWWTGEKLSYDNKTDVSANGMYNNAKEKGPIDTIPETPGLCVYKQGHIGVYIGEGFVIEANRTSVGVIKTPLKGKGSTPWTHWLKCPYIEYWKTYSLQEVAVDNAMAAGVITDRVYWLDVLNGKEPVNIEYLTKVFMNTGIIKGGK